MLDSLELIFFLLAIVLLYNNRINRSQLWPATVTPLASIIGSGFLVSGPLLVGIFYEQAIYAMLMVVGVAYMIGEVMRFNIRFVEPYLKLDSPLIEHRINLRIKRVEILSDISLTCAYIISVAFYIRLLSAFVLKLADIESSVLANFLATFILLGIIGAGWYRDLKGLVAIEKHAVNNKLAIIPPWQDRCRLFF